MHYLDKISRTYGAPPTYAVCFDASAIIGAVVGAAGLFGGRGKSKSPPPIPEPAVAPDPDDKAIKSAQRRRGARRRQQSGRLSTINTGSQNTVLG